MIHLYIIILYQWSPCDILWGGGRELGWERIVGFVSERVSMYLINKISDIKLSCKEHFVFITHTVHWVPRNSSGIFRKIKRKKLFFIDKYFTFIVRKFWGINLIYLRHCIIERNFNIIELNFKLTIKACNLKKNKPSTCHMKSGWLPCPSDQRLS